MLCIEIHVQLRLRNFVSTILKRCTDHDPNLFPPPHQRLPNMRWHPIPYPP